MAGSKKRKQKPFVVIVSIGVVITFVVATGFGIYLGFSGRKSAGELIQQGQEAFQAGDYEKAIDSYQAAIEKEPNSSEAYNLLGMAYRFTANQTGNAEYRSKEAAAFRKAVDLEPANYVALVNLGTTLYFQGDKKGAAEYLKKALEIYPDHPDKAQIEQMINEAQ
jgi:Flp pilus assembly protein TadD